MLISPAFAQTAGASSQPGGLAAFAQLALPMVLVVVAYWFLIHRPQARRQAAFRARIDAVRKGDSVVTAGGIVGKVTRVEDAHVELEIAPNTRVRVVKATLAEIGGGAKPAND